jgi:hypothetical protein
MTKVRHLQASTATLPGNMMMPANLIRVAKLTMLNLEKPGQAARIALFVAAGLLKS